jgi:RNAse (barnase) inhibitor barstar
MVVWAVHNFPVTLPRITMSKPIITIDGACFSSLDEFFMHFQVCALNGASWGTNLDAFNDVLRGGFGTPEDGFTLVWKHHNLSKDRLGYSETQRVLRKRVTTCHFENVTFVTSELKKAEACEGATVFDWLVEIIKDHGPGGSEHEDGIELVLD